MGENSKREKSLYAQDGVDLEAGDDFSSYFAKVCKHSFENSPFIVIHDMIPDNFRGPRGIHVKNEYKRNCFLALAPDGIGTKPIVTSSAIGEIVTYADVYRDLIAMTGGDITRWGGVPVAFTNVLDVASLGERGDAANLAFCEMAGGLMLIAKEQDLVILNGETAELGVCVGSENPNALIKFNIAGMMLGLYDPKKMITGKTLAPGQRVIALREYGFRSNGISAVRKALAIKYGHQWYKNPAAKSDLERAAMPSVLYDKFLATANGWYPEVHEGIPMHAIAHITGGGIPGKFGKDILFPNGLSATLNMLWEPPAIMQELKNVRGISDREVYEVWNGGQGVLAVVDQDRANDFIDLAESFKIEGRDCGFILEDEKPVLEIRSQFGDEGEFLKYQL